MNIEDQSKAEGNVLWKFRRMPTWFAAVIAGMTAATFGYVLPASTSGATTSQPRAAWSYYVLTSSTTPTTLYTLGCNQVHAEETHHYDAYVFLDFGAMRNTNGAQTTINGYALSQSQVETLSKKYARGFSACRKTTTYTVTLAIGTNNSVTQTKTEGKAFANTVNAVATYVTTNLHDVSVWGASDIETWITDGGVTYSSTQSFYTGYAANHGRLFIDNGAASSCAYSTPCGGATGKKWTRSDYYTVSWGDALAYPLPQIYYTGDALDWHYVAGSSSLQPLGPLDEHDLKSTSNTSAQAWTQLSKEFSNMAYASEVHDS